LATLAVDQFAPRGSRVIVVSLHSDEEVLGCGGTLALLAREGYEVLVVGVTDGEAAYPGSTIWTHAHWRANDTLNERKASPA
jgi:LmbE family N-acetylglucosaminyl deacetylase